MASVGMEGLGKLENARALLEGLFAHAPVGIQIYDVTGRSLAVNDAFLALFGTAPPPEYNVLRDEQAARAGQLEALKRAFSGDVVSSPPIWYDPRKVEHVHVTEGRRCAMECTAFPLFDASGKVEYVVFTFKDVTAEFEAREQAEAERDQLREALERERQTREALHKSEEQLLHSQKMEAVGRLAGGVAHDFNNLLTALSGYNAILLERLGPDDPLRAYASRVAQAAARASALTLKLLAFSRKQPFSPVDLDLNALVSGTLTMLHRLIGEDIELSCALDTGLGRVHADPAELEQVIANLVVNARDAMPKGGRLALETSNVDRDGRWVRLTVRDNGIGIEPEARAHLFEPFFTTKEPGKGTGLGLAMVYGIVSRSGGRISVESEPGRGATFEVLLPRIADGAPVEELAQGAPVPVFGGSETILLVEDDESVREFVRFVLEQKGFRVLEAEDGKVAIERVLAHPGRIDLLISDVVMPNMDGSELAAEVRKLRPEIRVLHISGYPGDTLERHGSLGAPNAFLPKPFSRDTLLARVRSILDEKN